MRASYLALFASRTTELYTGEQSEPGTVPPRNLVTLFSPSGFFVFSHRSVGLLFTDAGLGDEKASEGDGDSGSTTPKSVVFHLPVVKAKLEDSTAEGEVKDGQHEVGFVGKSSYFAARFYSSAPFRTEWMHRARRHL